MQIQILPFGEGKSQQLVFRVELSDGTGALFEVVYSTVIEIAPGVRLELPVPDDDQP